MTPGSPPVSPAMGESVAGARALAKSKGFSNAPPLPTGRIVGIVHNARSEFRATTPRVGFESLGEKQKAGAQTPAFMLTALARPVRWIRLPLGSTSRACTIVASPATPPAGV